MFNSLLGLLNTRAYRNKILCRQAGEFRVSIAPTVPTSIRFASMAPPRVRRDTIGTFSSQDSVSYFELVSKSRFSRASRTMGLKYSAIESRGRTQRSQAERALYSLRIQNAKIGRSLWVSACSAEASIATFDRADAVSHSG